MRYLLDTHAFLWWIMDDPQLSRPARKLIEDGDNEILLSAASGWEVAIKSQRGRLDLPDRPNRFVIEQMTASAFQPLPILMSHVLEVANLPDHHRDPFDRLLIAQSRLEGMPILTSDPLFALYEVDLLW